MNISRWLTAVTTHFIVAFIPLFVIGLFVPRYFEPLTIAAISFGCASGTSRYQFERKSPELASKLPRRNLYSTLTTNRGTPSPIQWAIIVALGNVGLAATLILFLISFKLLPLASLQYSLSYGAVWFVVILIRLTLEKKEVMLAKGHGP